MNNNTRFHDLFIMRILLISLFFMLISSAQDADAVLANARYVTSLNKNDLSGKLRKGRAEVPVKLYMRENNIQMQYQPSENKGWRGIHLQLNKESCELFDLNDGNLSAFPDSKIGQAISDTDLSYEDLSLRFLYWPSPKIIGEDTVKTQGCYIVSVNNPDGRGNYSRCDLWIHKKASALMQMKGYDKNGEHIKTFRVAELMKVDGDFAVEKMKVETIKNGRTKSISYLIFDNPEEKRKVPRSRKLK